MIAVMLIFEKTRCENNCARHFCTETFLIVRSDISFYRHHTEFSPRGSEKQFICSVGKHRNKELAEKVLPWFNASIAAATIWKYLSILSYFSQLMKTERLLATADMICLKPADFMKRSFLTYVPR